MSRYIQYFKIEQLELYLPCRWALELSGDDIYIEWNMYFACLGHNICDSHAGHLKR